MKEIKKKYLDQVKKLTADERERLLSRMSGKLPSRLEKQKISAKEALAMQLELEDEQLKEWRRNFKLIKDGEEIAKKRKAEESGNKSSKK